jgi:hypothetical protein
MEITAIILPTVPIGRIYAIIVTTMNIAGVYWENI